MNIPFLEEEVEVGLPLGPDKEQTTVSRPLGAPKAGQEVAQTGLRELNFYSAPEHFKKYFLSNQNVSKQLRSENARLTTWVCSASRRAYNAVRLHSARRGRTTPCVPPNLMNPCHKFCPGSQRGGCWDWAAGRGCFTRARGDSRPPSPL